MGILKAIKNNIKEYNENRIIIKGNRISVKEIERIANQIANKMQKEFNPSKPTLEGDIQGEKVDYRIACVHSYLATEGTTIVIRKVRKTSYLTYDGLINDNYITEEGMNFIIKAVIGKANILFVGETGSGKTELMKFLLKYIPNNEVIVTIEDSLEFNVKKINPNSSCTSFRVRPNADYRDIIAMSLRLNVQRLLLQEARGPEVGDLIDAMSTGHNVMTTMHARGSDAVPARIKQMLKNDNEPFESLKQRIYALVDLVIEIEKFETDKGIHRQVKAITEYYYNTVTNECRNILLYESRHQMNKCSEKLSKLIERED
jgi:pilus assembly protein CpaF